jgi:hypothetical protein
MRRIEKDDLVSYCREGLSFNTIRKLVSCSDSTIRKYLKIFGDEE